MVPGKPKYQYSYQRELGRQLGVICMIKIMESIMGITALVVKSCDNISALRQASLDALAVTSLCKQADLIYRL